MVSSCSDFQLHNQKSFRIKHEEDPKFFAKLLSKENSKPTIPSFRVYYGDVPSSVPFMWESQPGTPKHALSQTSNLPPLTPPPSYYSNNNTNKKPTRKNSRSKLFHALIKKLLNPKKSHFPPSPSSSSSSLSSSSSHSSFSAPTTPCNNLYRRRRVYSTGSSFDEVASAGILSGSQLGVGMTSSEAKSGGNQAGVFKMKKALFSINSQQPKI